MKVIKNSHSVEQSALWLFFFKFQAFNLCTVLEGVASMLLATKINSRGLKMDKDGMVFFTIVIGSFFTFGVFFIAMIETLRFIFG